MIEASHARRWIKEALEREGLTAHRGQAPYGASTPYVTYSYSGGSDSYYTGARRALVRLTYQLQVTTTEETVGQEKAYADSIDAALHGMKNVLIAEGVHMVGSSRDKVIERDEVFEGVRYFYQGGIYVIYLAPP